MDDRVSLRDNDFDYNDRPTYNPEPRSTSNYSSSGTSSERSTKTETKRDDYVAPATDHVYSHHDGHCDHDTGWYHDCSVHICDFKPNGQHREVKPYTKRLIA